jgi:hypothetical protein
LNSHQLYYSISYWRCYVRIKLLAEHDAGRLSALVGEGDSKMDFLGWQGIASLVGVLVVIGLVLIGFAKVTK